MIGLVSFALLVAPLVLSPRLPTESGAGKLPAAAEIKAVPFVKQQGDWCGPAALASVLQFYGEKVSQEEIAREIYLSGVRATLNLDLLLYARGKGYVAEAGEGGLAKLKEEIAAGRPVICLEKERFALSSRNHFVVVFGYDEKAKTFRLHSGSKGNVKRGYDAFDKAWKKGDRWRLTISGKQEKPPEKAADEKPQATAKIPSED